MGHFVLLKDAFLSLLSRYGVHNEKSKELWLEIVNQYSGCERYYHNLIHLNQVFYHLSLVKDEINHWDSCLFALFYHDIIYNTKSNDNEEQSALYVMKVLREINVAEEVIEQSCLIIRATKTHHVANDNDIDFFTDSDLTILGQSWKDYQIYAKQIRMEYNYYEDDVYFEGRKKVLQHFLSMNRIYKSNFFFNMYESNAKENLMLELAWYV